MKDYIPSSIMSDEHAVEMNEQFLRYLASTAENKDPITPFSRIPTIDKKLQIKVNTTNDLKWLIDKVLNGSLFHPALRFLIDVERALGSRLELKF